MTGETKPTFLFTPFCTKQELPCLQRSWTDIAQECEEFLGPKAGGALEKAFGHRFELFGIYVLS